MELFMLASCVLVEKYARKNEKETLEKTADILSTLICITIIVKFVLSGLV